MIKSNDQLLDYFQKFHVAVEQETGLSLKAVHFDNGNEYTGLFEEFCRKHGIKHEKTILKAPQQNGLAEKMNHTICEKVRSMFSHAKFRKYFRMRQCVQQQISSISLWHTH